MTTIGWIVSIAAFVVAAVIFFLLGIRYRKNVAEREISSAEEEATRIINEAIKAGETKKRESILEAKDEIHKQRVEADRELKERTDKESAPEREPQAERPPEPRHAAANNQTTEIIEAGAR